MLGGHVFVRLGDGVYAAAAARCRLAFSGVLWQHGGAARGVESVGVLSAAVQRVILWVRRHCCAPRDVVFCLRLLRELA